MCGAGGGDGALIKTFNTDVTSWQRGSGGVRGGVRDVFTTNGLRETEMSKV